MLAARTYTRSKPSCIIFISSIKHHLEGKKKTKTKKKKVEGTCGISRVQHSTRRTAVVVSHLCHELRPKDTFDTNAGSKLRTIARITYPFSVRSALYSRFVCKDWRVIGIVSTFVSINSIKGERNLERDTDKVRRPLGIDGVL